MRKRISPKYNSRDYFSFYYTEIYFIYFIYLPIDVVLNKYFFCKI